KIIMVGQPCRHGGRQRILYPSAHFRSIERGYTRHGYPVGPEIHLGVPFIIRSVLFEMVDTSQSFFEMIAAVSRPVAQLSIQVVMKIALPGRDSAVVGRPHRLQRDRWRPSARCCAKLILREVPLLFQESVREMDRRLTPEILPPACMAGSK